MIFREINSSINQGTILEEDNSRTRRNRVIKKVNYENNNCKHNRTIFRNFKREIKMGVNKIKDMVSYYEVKIQEIDNKYLSTQDNNNKLVDYKKRSWFDVKLKEVYEDFISDLKILSNEKT